MGSRFAKELLDSDMDIRMSDVSEEGARLRIVMRRGGPRVPLGLLFLVPGMALLVGAVSSGGYALWISTVFFSPILIGLSFLFLFGSLERSFDRETRMFVKSFRFFGFVSSESVQMPENGTVLLAAKMSSGGGKTPGGAMRYSVSVPSCSGSGFTAYHDYDVAHDFAGKIAGFLSYTLEDSVDPEYRRNMKFPSFQ